MTKRNMAQHLCVECRHIIGLLPTENGKPVIGAQKQLVCRSDKVREMNKTWVTGQVPQFVPCAAQNADGFCRHWHAKEKVEEPPDRRAEEEAEERKTKIEVPS